MENFDWYMGAIVPYVNFVVFLVAGYFLFRKPVRSLFSGQRESFEQMLKEAAAAKEAAALENKKLKDQLGRLDGELETMRQNAEKAVSEESRVMVENAEKLANHMTSEASRIAEAEVTKAKTELREEIVRNLTAAVAGKIKGEVSLDQQHQIVKSRVQYVKSLNTEV
ncbi:MAG: hypothetical protein CMP10_21620 [Zetaproteobacteria bacterium]|nr:hypothetical protein [Pseudobdellovibrionaceae bacterium]